MLVNVLVVGLGEIGLPLYQMLTQSGIWTVFGYDKDHEKTINQLEEVPTPILALHICIPCAKEEVFRKVVLSFIEQFKPRILIIHSTVPPHTCIELYAEAKSITPLYLVHSPVRGTHAHMLEDMKSYVKFIGGINDQSSAIAFSHLTAAGFKCQIIGNTTESELAKIFETSYAATMIATYHEMQRISEYFGADFSKIMDIIVDTNKHRLDRPVFYPAFIGGHCLMQNIVLLNSIYSSILFKWVKLSNDSRKLELSNPDTNAVMEECKKKFEEMRKWTKEKLGEEGKE